MGHLQCSWHLYIGHVANSKCNQGLNEISRFLYSHYIQKISKVVHQKTLSCSMPGKLGTILCYQHELGLIACTDIIQHMPDTSFFVKNFPDFPGVREKRSRFCPVIWWQFSLATSAGKNNMNTNKAVSTIPKVQFTMCRITKCYTKFKNCYSNPKLCSSLSYTKSTRFTLCCTKKCYTNFGNFHSNLKVFSSFCYTQRKDENGSLTCTTSHLKYLPHTNLCTNQANMRLESDT